MPKTPFIAISISSTCSCSAGPGRVWPPIVPQPLPQSPEMTLMLPTPRPDELDVISPKVVPGHHSVAVHECNGTWELVECPPSVCPVDNRWVLKTKQCADGTIERLKARLVACRFTQRSGIDCFETYAPTAPLPAIRTTTALAAALDLHLHSINISNMFLNGDINVDIYMRQPEGFVLGGRNMVCKLNKGIYGTKQGARVADQVAPILGRGARIPCDVQHRLDLCLSQWQQSRPAPIPRSTMAHSLVAAMSSTRSLSRVWHSSSSCAILGRPSSCWTCASSTVS